MNAGRFSTITRPGSAISALAAAAAVISILFIGACGSKPVDTRSVLPADSLIYLEAPDLGRALEAVTSNPGFRRHANVVPDLTALKGMMFSVAVTGFQASEEATPGQDLVLNFKPRFVAAAETNAWNFQTLRFTESRLGEFVNELYGGEVQLETSEKHGGTAFTWTAVDGRKAHALVLGSLILFGNDEAAIDACVGVINGGDSMNKSPKVAAFSREVLASGYVSPEGVAQLANIAGVSFAIGSGEDGDVRDLIARIMPQIVRNSISDVTWTARPSDEGLIEDIFEFSLAGDTAGVLSETVAGGNRADPDLERFVPSDFYSSTSYKLQDARIAWRSVLITARTKVDTVFGNLLTVFSPALFEPYGISDGESFLGSVESPVQTVSFDADGGEVAVIARVRDLSTLRRSLAKDLDLSRPAARFEDAEVWRSDDGEITAALAEKVIIVGETGSVEKCLAARKSAAEWAAGFAGKRALDPSAAILTYARDPNSGPAAVQAISGVDIGAGRFVQNYVVETRFDRIGMRRRSISDIGLIGTIIGRVGAGER